MSWPPASPRRRELLAQAGLNFQVIPANVDESVIPGESAQEMVRRLSRIKAETIAGKMETGYVVGADSTVVFENGPVGKPVDSADAVRMLGMLSGTNHQVSTGVTVIDAATGRSLTDCMTGDIALRELGDDEIQASVDTGSPLDKAGAYAIQDEDLKPGELVSGCFTNVVGLPVCRVREMLAELGCPLPPDWAVPNQPRCQTDCPFRKKQPARKSRR